MCYSSIVKTADFNVPAFVEGLKIFKEYASLQYTNTGPFQQALLKSSSFECIFLSYSLNGETETVLQKV